MEVFGWEDGDGSMGMGVWGWDSGDGSLWMGVWGWECGDGSVGLGTFFLLFLNSSHNSSVSFFPA